MATVVTPPEPLSLEQAKAHLRVDVDDPDQDDLIDGLISAARGYVEDYTGLILTPRAITETAPFLGRWIDLDSSPVISVDAIRYPLAGVMTALPASSWLVSQKTRPVRILPASWGWGLGTSISAFGFAGRRADLPVEVDVTAGFATPDLVPPTIKQAMLLLCQSWFDNRSAVEAGTRAAAIEVPFTVDVLLRRWRLATV